MGNLGCLTWIRLQQSVEQYYPFLTVRAVFSCVQTKVWLPMFGIFNVHTDVTACGCTWGCTDTVKESALKVDSGRKIPGHAREPNVLAAHSSNAVPIEPCKTSLKVQKRSDQGGLPLSEVHWHGHMQGFQYKWSLVRGGLSSRWSLIMVVFHQEFYLLC